MNSVDRIKAICKERKIAISKLEKDLGFSNGYIGQLRKGTLPDGRLFKVAEYLNVSVDYLVTGEQKNKPTTVSGDELSDAEREFITLFRLVPEQDRDLVVEMVRAALRSKGLL